MLPSKDDGKMGFPPMLSYVILLLSFLLVFSPILERLDMSQAKCIYAVAQQSRTHLFASVQFLYRQIAEVRFTFPLLCETLTFSKAMEVAWWKLPFTHRLKDVEVVKFPEPCELALFAVNTCVTRGFGEEVGSPHQHRWQNRKDTWTETF